MDKYKLRYKFKNYIRKLNIGFEGIKTFVYYIVHNMFLFT